MSDKRRVNVPKRSSAEIYLGSLSPKASASMRSALLRAVRFLRAPDDVLSFPWHRLGPEQVEAIKIGLTKLGYKPATIKLTMDAIRCVQRADTDEEF